MKKPESRTDMEQMMEQDRVSEAIRFAELQAQFEGILDTVWCCEAWERDHPLTVSTFAPSD